MLVKSLEQQKEEKKEALKGDIPQSPSSPKKDGKKERFFKPPIGKKEKKQKRMEGKEVRTKVGEE